jgi:hypothetical protein
LKILHSKAMLVYLRELVGENKVGAAVAAARSEEHQ